MCIALFSTAHPDYALILLNNRDEFLGRPTAPADWWEDPNGQVLGGRDLLRKEQGTWLGVTRQGRIAVLTNFREEGAIQLEARSRGAMVNAFLTQSPKDQKSTQDFLETLVEGEGLKGVGGFSLVCGKIGEPLAVISNRTPNVEGITWILREKGDTIGLSNAAFANRTWPKVLRGEELLASAIESSIANKSSEEKFIVDLLHLLSDDTLPRMSQGVGWDSYIKELRKSILIPPVGGEGTDDMSAEDLAAAESGRHIAKATANDGQSGVYGTQKQTIVLVDNKGKVIFVERTLYDASGRAIPITERDRRFVYNLQDQST